MIVKPNQEQLIDAILSAYHTTRLIDAPASAHILTKPYVNKAFEAYRLEATQALQAENERLRAFRDAIFGDRRSDLSNIIRAIEDEGDRAYFGSTNDADELRTFVHWLEDQELRTALEAGSSEQ